ncbi:MAG TPA: hypothetical protein DCW90_06205 [Lachnospiraceae bacterium]|nr:hypothetical protein [uncultured Lachnoclostridium sp.]HAU85090.1 hypothetical protein [Lachnospiraceae bacterium]
MALITEGNINQYGVEEEYWRLLNININVQYKYADITVASYRNKEARDSNAEPMNLKKVRAKWNEEEFENYFSPQATTYRNKNIYELAYEYIKENDEHFANAIDH